MAKVSNKQIAEAFRNAVPWLRNGVGGLYRGGKHEFMCYAISAGNGGARDSAKVDAAGEAAQKVISKRLGDCATLNCWLFCRGIDWWLGDIQAYRHAWLQQLIEEFDNK